MKELSFKKRLPINLQPKDRALFLEKQIYVISEIIFNVYDKVILTHSGICLSNFKVLEFSAPKVGVRKSEIYRTAYYQYLKSTKITEPLDKNLFIVHGMEGLNTLDAWIIQALPRLVSSLDYLSDPTLILPSSSTSYSFINEGIKPFALKNKLYYNNDEYYSLKQLSIPEVIDPYWASKDVFKRIRELYLQYIDRLSLDFPPLNLVYISQESEGKKIKNEAALNSLLKEYGIESIQLSGLPFLFLIALISKTKLLISNTSECLSLMTFMTEQSVVFELIPQSSTLLSDKYWTLADIQNHNYYYQFCPIVKRNKTELDSDIEVDLALFETNLKQVFQNHKFLENMNKGAVTNEK